MGQHVWLLTATIVTELLVITKWSQGMFTVPTPPSVKVGLTAGAVLLVLYPIMQVRDLLHPRYSDLIVSLPQFGLPAIRRYIRKHQKGAKRKTR
jgi:phosphatidylserine synthase 2